MQHRKLTEDWSFISLITADFFLESWNYCVSLRFMGCLLFNESLLVFFFPNRLFCMISSSKNECCFFRCMCHFSVWDDLLLNSAWKTNWVLSFSNEIICSDEKIQVGFCFWVLSFAWMENGIYLFLFMGSMFCRVCLLGFIVIITDWACPFC